MSLYNTILGHTPITKALNMFIDGRAPANRFPRFRDAFLIKEGHILQIYTRLGNKASWEKEIDQIRSMPGYIDEEIVDYFDNTYRIFQFKLKGKNLENGKQVWSGFNYNDTLYKITLEGMYRKRSELLGIKYDAKEVSSAQG